MNNILTVNNDDLKRLNPEDAVAVFSQLLWSEATAIGLAKNLINIPSAINVADGGIDAEVNEIQNPGGQSIFKPGFTRYQIKTGEFNLGHQKYIDEILFKKDSYDLKPRIKTCLEKGGALVVVLFGWDGPEQTDDQLVGKFLTTLESQGFTYKKDQLEIWRQNTLISFIQNYPALALQINGRAGARFDSHLTWSNQDQNRTVFVNGETQSKIIEGIRMQLRRAEPGTHIRVLGEPGVGKTRMVLEATRENDLAPMVIYTLANNFSDSDLLTDILRGKFQAILVLDECDPGLSAYFTNKLKIQCPDIQIISIYSDWENSTGVSYVELPRLNDSNVSEIIQNYGILKDQADRWADFCSGSPRVAHVVGLNLISYPEDILREPSSVRVWERYIAGSRDVNSDEFRRIQVVLRYISLFKRFGYGQYIAQEAEIIANLIQSRNPDISYDHFHEIVRELRQRKILQGENTLYITPKLLHIKLWIDWWNIYGRNFDINSLDLSSQLFDWFFEMFEYASASEVASIKAKELLGANGPFQTNHELIKSKLGARFFHYLAKSEPQYALSCLQRTLGTWSNDELRKFIEGRRDVVWALEYIVAWRPLFVGGARLLLTLAEAENESWSNNASGVFAEIFKISRRSGLSRTEASPEERFPVLREALESDSSERRQLGLNACKMALAPEFGGFINSFPNPLQKKPDFWTPKTWEELFESYSRIWNFLFSKIDRLPPNEKSQAIKILINASRGLAHFENMNKMVFQTLEALSINHSEYKYQIFESVVQLLHYDTDEWPDELRNKWEIFKDRLVGKDYHSRLERYVGMNILEDQVDKNGESTNQLEETIKLLANEASINSEILLSELDWLISTDSAHAYSFGYEVGKGDSIYKILPEILRRIKTTEQSINLNFIGGYLRVMYEKEPTRWENLLDQLEIQGISKKLIPELIYRSGGLSERSAQRILNLLLERSIEPHQLMFFAYGYSTRKLNDTTVIDWIEALLDRKTSQACSVALAIFANYYFDKSTPREMPIELAYNVITWPGHVEIDELPIRDQMAGYHWKMICQAFVHKQSHNAINLARFILDHFKFDDFFARGSRDDGLFILTLIAQLYPNQMWNCVSDYITIPLDSRAIHIQHWLRGSDTWGKESEGALSLMVPGDVWNWVDQNIEQRAWFLAACSPKLLFKEDNKICWAREILIRYGYLDDVRSELKSNFSTEGWTGPASLHLQQKINNLLDYSSKESNAIVTSWMTEYIGDLQEEFKYARIREERDGH